MFFLHAKMPNLKRTMLVIAAFSLMLGLILQAVCFPEDFRIEQEVRYSGNNARPEHCFLNQEHFLNKQNNQILDCFALENGVILTSSKKPDVPANDYALSVLAADPFQKTGKITTILRSFSEKLISPPQNSLFALKTSLLFYH